MRVYPLVPVPVKFVLDPAHTRGYAYTHAAPCNSVQSQCDQRIRSLRYINLHFTYLLTLLTVLYYTRRIHVQNVTCHTDEFLWYFNAYLSRFTLTTHVS